MKTIQLTELRMLPPIYSRRKRALEGKAVDVYEYEKLPAKIRIQTIHIVDLAIGPYYNNDNYSEASDLYDFILRELRREVGKHSLAPHSSTPQKEITTWLETTVDIEHWIDAVEYCLRGIDKVVRRNPNLFPSRHLEPDAAIAEFNGRMQEAAIGYQYASGEIIRIDSQYMHAEVVLPALSFLGDQRFASAESEYKSAHAAYRNGELEDCIVDCGKAFESVLKIIGATRGWPIKETDPASKLIQAAVDARFIASYHAASLNHLKGLIESSTPTLRNKEGGHGAGALTRKVSPELAALQLHQTAAMIVYLVSRDRAAEKSS